jgi:hypothetical protein
MKSSTLSQHEILHAFPNTIWISEADSLVGGVERTKAQWEDLLNSAGL